MQVQDLKDGQLVAIIKPYQGLHKGLKGIVLGYSRKREKVLVKLSSGAAERLNVLDNRFVVEITYYIPDEKAMK